VHRTINLLHSPLTIPADEDQHLRVIFYEHLELSTGVAFRAHVQRGEQHLGVIESCGTGESRFHPSDMESFGLRDFDAFVAACLFKGEPATEHQVHEALVDEFEISLAIGAANEQGRAVAREVANGFSITLATVQKPRNQYQRAQIADQLVTEPGQTWELWTGFRWEPLSRPQPV